jgi:hypothetical protein
MYSCLLAIPLIVGTGLVMAGILPTIYRLGVAEERRRDALRRTAQIGLAQTRALIDRNVTLIAEITAKRHDS